MNKRIDKKRKKLIVNTSKVKQRFGIRKLTTGVTSVLLGAFLIWGVQPLLKQQKVRLQMIMRNLAILVTILHQLLILRQKIIIVKKLLLKQRQLN